MKIQLSKAHELRIERRSDTMQIPRQRYEDFLDSFLNASCDQEFYEVLSRTGSEFGFDKVIYLYTPTEDHPLHKPANFSTYAPDWMDYWIDQGYDKIDIGVRKTMESGRDALTLDVCAYLEQPDDGEASQAIEALWEAKTEGGCGKIFSHQLLHLDDSLGAMGFVSADLNSREFSQVCKEYGSILSNIIHLSHSRLSRDLIAQSFHDFPPLSPRQKDIVGYLFEGRSCKEIATLLKISDNTVAFHVSEMKRKYQCKTLMQLVALLVRREKFLKSRSR